MALVNLTINGQAVQVRAGSTILEAAQAAGIDIPTLCDHPAVAPIGACRMCLVEVERQAALQTACTFPVAEGMVVDTDSPRCVEARVFMLHLLFSERNHYCMYCQMSGDCELQDLAYRYGVVDWPYPRPTDPLPVDATREYFSLDHNRCVLCRRCARACAELVANHTLAVDQRGIHSMITADLDVPMGDSSCIQCGTCLQICPTGALIDRKSAYRGREEQVERTKSTCAGCSIGCGVELITRANHLIRIDGDWNAEVSKGLLCRIGRFDPVYDDRTRLTTPQIRRNGSLEPATWDEALDFVAEGLQDRSGLAAFITPRATNETMSQFGRMFRSIGAKTVAALGGLAPIVGKQGRLADLDASDFIILIDADLTVDHQVAGAFVRRAVDRGARLALVADENHGLADWAAWHVNPDRLERVVEIAARASSPTVVYTAGLSSDAASALAPLAGRASFIGLDQGTNSRGAASAAMPVSNGQGGTNARALYVLAEDDDIEMPRNGADFLVVQASYTSPLTEVADVVLPAPIWAEQSGTLTNTEGRVQTVRAVLESPDGVWPVDHALKALATRMGLAL